MVKPQIEVASAYRLGERRAPHPTGGQPVIVTRCGQPVAVLSAIDAEQFYDHVLAHAPEFVTGRKAAPRRTLSGSARARNAIASSPGCAGSPRMPPTSTSRPSLARRPAADPVTSLDSRE